MAEWLGFDCLVKLRRSVWRRLQSWWQRCRPIRRDQRPGLHLEELQPKLVPNELLGAVGASLVGSSMASIPVLNPERMMVQMPADLTRIGAATRERDPEDPLGLAGLLEVSISQQVDPAWASNGRIGSAANNAEGTTPATDAMASNPLTADPVLAVAQELALFQSSTASPAPVAPLGGNSSVSANLAGAAGHTPIEASVGGPESFTAAPAAVGGGESQSLYAVASEEGATGAEPKDRPGGTVSTSTYLSTSANPSTVGQALTLTATVSTADMNTPTGNIEFLDGSNVLATVIVGQVMGTPGAQFTTSSLTVGNHDLSAVYEGDSTYAGSTSETVSQSVQLVSTGTSLTSDQPNGSAPGQTVHFTANVLPMDSGTPTGTVTFEDGGTVVDTETLTTGMTGAEATWSTNSLTVGAHNITATYNGDGTYAGSTSPIVTQTVQQQPTSTSLWTSQNPIDAGQPLTISANVMAMGAGTPTGTVSFYNGTTLLDTESVSSGMMGVGASLTTSSLPVGTNTLTAVYSGDTAFSGSTSIPASQTVNMVWVNNSPTFTITPDPVPNPNLTNPGDQSNAEGDNVNLAISGSDPSGYSLAFAAVNLPPGLSIDPNSGAITGTVQTGAAEDFGGIYPVTVIASNGQGGSSTVSFTWNISQTIVAPVVTNPGNQSNSSGDSVSLPVVATQANGDSLVYFADNLPSGLSIDQDSGVISGTIDPSALSSAPFAVTVGASDQDVSSSQTFTWTVTPGQQAPVLTNPGDQSNAVGDSVSVDVSATSPEGNTLTFAAAGLPPGLSIDPVSGTISGTLSTSASSASPYVVTVSASDGINTTSQTLNWTVAPVGVTSPGDQSNVLGDSVSLPIDAVAANGSVSYSAVGLPPGLSIDSGSGIISGTITGASSTPYVVTVSASDGTNSASQTFNWTVAALALTNPGDQNSVEGANVSLQLSVVDSGGTPTVSATGLPAGVSISSSGLISGTILAGASASSPDNVTVTATDGSNSVSQNLVWTVTPRVVLVNPGAQGNAVGDTVSLPVTASSPDGAVSFSAIGLPPGLSIDPSSGDISGTLTGGSAGAYQVTVSASSNGYSASQPFAWNVSTLYLGAVPDQTNNDGDSVSLTVPVHYNGMGSVTLAASGLPSGLSLGSNGVISGTLAADADVNGPYSVTVTGSDPGGDGVSQSFTWNVNPVLTVDNPSDQTNGVGDVVSLALTATDASNAAVTWGASGLPLGLSIDTNSGAITGTIAAGAASNSPDVVTVTATDANGVSASQTFNWHVPPLFVVNPGTVSSVDGQSVTLTLQAEDASGSSVAFTASGLPGGLAIGLSSGIISGAIASNADQGGPYQVSVTATDGTNSQTVSWLWQVSEVGLTNPGDQTSTEGDTIALQLQAQSGSGNPVTFSARGLPDGLSISLSGLISGTLTPGAAADGPFSVTVVASDGVNQTSQTFNWNVNPYISIASVADQSNTEGDSVSLGMAATDVGLSVAWAADGLPDGLTIDPDSGTISGMVASGAALGGPYVVTVTASDGTYSSSASFNWNVNPAIPSAPPELVNPGAQSNQAGDEVNLQLQSSDAAGYPLQFSAVNLPDGLSIDPDDGTITGTIADDAVSNAAYSVVVMATDPFGNGSTQTLNWVVTPAPIVVTANPIQAVEGQDSGSLTMATFTTSDLQSTADEFTATLTWGDGNSDLAIIDGSNGSFTVSAEHTFANAGTYPVALTVSKKDGSSASATTTATVTDATQTLEGGFQQGAVVGQSSNLVVGTLQDSYSGLDATAFSVSITPGDGNAAVAGQLQPLDNGEWQVILPYTYQQEGAYTATVTVTGPHGVQSTTTSTVEAGDVAAGVPATLTVASAAVGNLPAGEFSATINWGDNSATSAGTITVSNGLLTVTGNHTFTTDSIDAPGSVYQVSVTVDGPDGQVLLGSHSVEVTRPPSTGFGEDALAMAGQAFNNAELATFTDPNLSDTSGEFGVASVDWGDGTVDTNAVIVGSNGVFHVLGSHTYQDQGQYNVQINLAQDWGGAVTFKPLIANILADDGSPPVVIAGPKDVPGNSVYDYIAWTGNTPLSPEEAAGYFTINGAKVKPGVWNKSLVDGVAWVKSGSYNQVIDGKDYPDKRMGYWLEIYFANKPKQLHIKLINPKPKVPSVEDTINVVEVKVSAPDAPAKSFVPGKPTAGPLGLRKATINGTEGPNALRLILGGDIILRPGVLQQPALLWQAKVTLIGAGADEIQVGFIQSARTTTKNVQFVRGTKLVSSLQTTNYYTDIQPDTSGPWYSQNPAPTRLRDGRVLPPSILRGRSGTIGADDTPTDSFPMALPGTPVDSAERINLLINFTLSVSAITTDREVEVGRTYFPEATATWSENGSGTIDYKNAARPWSPDDAAKKITAPEYWTAAAAPEKAPADYQVGGPWANTVGKPEKWNG